MSKIIIKLQVEVPPVTATKEMYTSCPKVDPITITEEDHKMDLSIPTDAIPNIEFKLDENYKIQRGQIEKTKNADRDRCPGQSIITKAVWSGDANPKSPPKSDTDARIGRQIN